jgi:hypothetical protein
VVAGSSPAPGLVVGSQLLLSSTVPLLVVCWLAGFPSSRTFLHDCRAVLLARLFWQVPKHSLDRQVLRELPRVQRHVPLAAGAVVHGHDDRWWRRCNHHQRGHYDRQASRAEGPGRCPAYNYYQARRPKYPAYNFYDYPARRRPQCRRHDDADADDNHGQA